MRILTGTLLAAAALSACATAPPPPLPPAPSLAGSTWTAADINGSPAAPGVAATIEFGADGRVVGDSGCNRYSGPYKQTGQHVRFGQLVSTLRACTDPVASSQEARFLDALNNTEDAGMQGGQLVLRGVRGQIAFTRVGGQPAAVGEARFACDNGEQLTVFFQGATAKVSFPGGEDAGLIQSPAADGFLYESSYNSLRGTGDQVTWNRARMAPKQCRRV